MLSRHHNAQARRAASRRVREEMRAFVRGERREAALGALLGAATVVLAVALALQGGPWRWAAAPLAPMGALQAALGARSFWRSRRQASDLGVALASDPGRFQHDEQARVARILVALRVGLALAGALLVVGAAVALLRRGDEAWSAMGAGLAAEAALLLAMDAWALSRAKSYQGALARFLTDQGARPTTHESGDFE